jgi:demethylmenaquinone methyltransferase/2-methoxy-6-polyprenyl-1,4-benzoquinol methylase
VTKADLNKQPDEVADMFDGVAKRYDRTNNVLSAGNAPIWRFATVRAIDPQPGERILDIAAGTGTSSAALTKTGATVVAFDFSPGMVAEGRRRHPELEFIEGNAEKLPFADNEFDAVTISFGLRNINDPKAALAEMYRVLKPGGRLVICEFSKPPLALLRAGYNAYLAYVMPIVARATSSNTAAGFAVSGSPAWRGATSPWVSSPFTVAASPRTRRCSRRQPDAARARPPAPSPSSPSNPPKPTRAPPPETNPTI